MKLQLLSDLHLEIHPHFRPSPAPGADLLVLAGDIDAATAKEKVAKYFGDIPAGPSMAQPKVDVAAHSASRFATRQLIFAHAAVTDLQRGELLHDQRIARAGRLPGDGARRPGMGCRARAGPDRRDSGSGDGGRL